MRNILKLSNKYNIDVNMEENEFRDTLSNCFVILIFSLQNHDTALEYQSK